MPLSSRTTVSAVETFAESVAANARADDALSDRFCTITAASSETAVRRGMPALPCSCTWSTTYVSVGTLHTRKSPPNP